MKLNHDCVRALLLYLEENLEFDNALSVSEIIIDEFDSQDIMYSAFKLYEADYISGQIVPQMNAYPGLKINSITWEGHKFLDTIRDSKVWSNTKSVLSKVSSTSISFASTVASQVLSNIISQSLGGQPII